MSEKYFPFNSVSSDRKYKAEDWANYFKQFISNGVYMKDSTSLQVIWDSGLTVHVQPGSGFIAGRGYISDDSVSLTFGAANTSMSRIDRVVLKCDYVNRTITVMVKAGTASNSPVAPELERDADAYELSLCHVTIAANSTAISQALIVDDRLDSTVCGPVMGVITQVDATTLFNQYQAALANWNTQIQTDQAAYETQINSLIAQLDALVSSDAVANLQKQINDNKVTVDSALSLTSTNPVQNGKVTTNLAHLYHALLSVSSWTADTTAGTYTQTVTPTAVDTAPAITSAMYLSPPFCQSTSVAATNTALQAALTIINAGNTVTNDDGTVKVTCFAAPASDVDVYWYGRVTA